MVNLPIEYSDKPVTPFGGMAQMKRFLAQVGIREQLGTLDLPLPGSNHGYSSEQIIESFKTVLKLSLPRKKRPWMDSIIRNIEQLSFPFEFSNA